MAIGKLVVIKIGSGSFEQGFPVTLYIGEEGASFDISLDGTLPPFPQIPFLYTTWQSEYRHFLNPPRVQSPPLGKKPSTQQRAAYSVTDVNEKAEDLIKNLNQWLNSETFRPIKDKLQQKLKTDDTVRVIIQTEDPLLRRLPWYLWDLFASYRLAEVALSSPAFERVEKSVQPKAKVRILAILGDSSAPNPQTGIRLDINADKEFLESLPDAETVFLVEPNRQEFNDKLWDENGWDILFFAGHSSSQHDATTGEMYINPNESLTIPDLKFALQKAIERGLQLAIFNSCDGLGIARELAELQITQIIVMREPVPDLVAKEFLKYFLISFSNGQTLYLSVREARERLHGLEKSPCAFWLPVICQNPAENPVTWQGLQGIEAGINWHEVCQEALAQRRRLTTNPLTTGDGVEFAFDDIYIPLGLVERVKKEKRAGEISPEEGSQFYQPEEVTRTYKNDEFFAQVLKQGQSPKSQGRRLAVTGEPGAGKTTLLQKIAHWVAADTEHDVAIWVSLADLQGRTIEEYLLQRWLKDALGAVRVTPEMEEALALVFNRGRVWLLLDGVDEMAAGSSNTLAAVAAQITGWVAQARVVLTCRQNVWDAGKNALEGFDVYRNLDFDYPDGVAKFIHRWFARHSELGERLVAELAQAGKERIRDTVRNPLRLALLCRAWQIRQGGLPETKAGLYRQFVEALYQWKQEAFPTNSQQRQELNAALGRLALRGMEQSESRFRLKESLVSEVLGEEDEPLYKFALQLGWLNLVGVAVENPSERVYAFYHPTFQEYFAALAVDDWGYFLHHVPDNPSLGTYRIFEKQWKEVILLWFGRENVEKEKKEAFIKKLINFDDGCGSWNCQKVDKGFYEYRAYFFAGIVISEFKDCCLANAIVSQIVKCVVFLEPIAAGANAVLIETDRERAIARLTQLLDKTYDKYTRHKAADILGEIAVGNEGAIARLIQLLFDKIYDMDEEFFEVKSWIDRVLIKGKVANILGKIAVGNKNAIARLIQLLSETYDEIVCQEVADSLGQIAVGNEGAIARLIQLLDETSNEGTRRIVVESLGKIAVGNEGAIARLIQLLDETYDKYIRQGVADILGEIAVGNDGAIARLIQLLFDRTSNEDTRRKVAESLGKIAVGNEGAIAGLIQLLDKSSNKDTRSSVAESLGKIAVGNEGAINRLIQLLNETSNKDTHWSVADILGKIAVGNEGAINRLIQLLDETYNQATRRRVADILGKIAVGNEGAINRLIQLLNETSNKDTRSIVAESLGEIAVGNEGAIARLIQLLDETSDEFIRKKIPDSLRKIGVKNEGAIARFIQLWDENFDKYTYQEIDNILNEIAVGNEALFEPLCQMLLDKKRPNYNRGKVAESLGKIAVGNERAINRLIQLLDETSDEYTRLRAACILGEIAVGNEVAIRHLIQLFSETSDVLNRWRWKVAKSLGEIAVGNEGAIARLIQLLFDRTSHAYTSHKVADILGKIAVGNKGAIARLIQLWNEISDGYTHQIIGESLGKIAVGNKGEISHLIQLLNETSQEDIRRIIAKILGNIAIGNNGWAIASLIEKQDQIFYGYDCDIIANGLSKIAVVNEGEIARLIQLLDETSNKDTRRIIAKILGNIAMGNGGKISHLIQVFSKTPYEENRKLAADRLSKITVGNEGKIARLIQRINQIPDEFDRQRIAEILGQIEVGNQGEIAHLIQLLSKILDEFDCQEVTDSLSKIAVGNQDAIARLSQLLSETSDESTCRIVANSLDKIIETKQQYYHAFDLLKHNLADEIYQNKFDRYQASYKLIWQFTQNLTYAEFYKAWNYQETPVKKLEPTSTLSPKPQNNLWQKLWQYLNCPLF